MVPPEVWEKHPNLQITEINGNLYARMDVMKERTLEDGTKEEYRSSKKVPIARIVWALHNPGKQLRKGRRIFHLDGDGMNNLYENLTLNRGDQE
jgi:hypothetical protein